MFQSNDINLLPGQMRGREKKEKAKPAASRQPEFTNPENESRASKAASQGSVLLGLKSLLVAVKHRFSQKTIEQKQEPELAKTKEVAAEKKIKELKASFSPKQEPDLVLPKGGFAVAAKPPEQLGSRVVDQSRGWTGKLNNEMGEQAKGKILKEKIIRESKPEGDQGEIEVNLVPAGLTSGKAAVRSRRKFFLVSLGLAVVVMAILYGFFKLAGRSKLARLTVIRQETAEVSQAIENYSSFIKTALDFQKKIKSIEIVLSQHYYWSNALALLEENTIGNAYYESAEFDLADGITLKVVAKNWEALARQLLVFERQPFVEQLEVNGATLGSQGEVQMVKSTFRLKLRPETVLRGLSKN